VKIKNVYHKRIFTFLILLFFVCACQGDNISKPVVTVNGEKVTLGEFNERLMNELSMLRNHSSQNAENYERVREEVLNILIDEKIMFSRARDLALSVSDGEVTKKLEEIKEGYSAEGFEKILTTQRVNYDDWKKALKTRILLEKLVAADVNSRISVTEQEAMDYYYAHKKAYPAGIRVHVAQIVLLDREKADAVLKRLKRGEDFGTVAREVSIGPEAVGGGDLGFVSRDTLPEAIDAVIFSLRPGTVSKVIKSPYGYHIFRIIEKEEGDGRGFPELKEQIISDIRKQKAEQAYVLWLSELRSRAVIKIDRSLLKMGAAPEGRQAE